MRFVAATAAVFTLLVGQSLAATLTFEVSLNARHIDSGGSTIDDPNFSPFTFTTLVHYEKAPVPNLNPAAGFGYVIDKIVTPFDAELAAIDTVSGIANIRDSITVDAPGAVSVSLLIQNVDQNLLCGMAGCDFSETQITLQSQRLLLPSDISGPDLTSLNAFLVPSSQFLFSFFAIAQRTEADGDRDYVDYIGSARLVAAEEIPEPATLALFGAGLLGLTLRGRVKL